MSLIIHWKAQVFGDPSGERWEISVVRSDNEHGQKSWGWFDDRKLLISHSGGPCHWPLAPGLGPLMVKLAEQYAEKLNQALVANRKIVWDDLKDYVTEQDTLFFKDHRV